MQRMKRGVKRKRRGLRVVFVLIVLALLSVMVLYTPIFNITRINVTGAGYYSADDIRRASGIVPGENGFRKISLSPEAILGLRITDAENSIKALPHVKEARVRLVFPNSVNIVITERQPAAYLAYLGNYLTVDSDGYVMDVGQSPPEGDLKEIRGIEFTRYSIGKRIEATDIDYIRVGSDILAAIKKSDADSEFLMWPLVNWVDIVDGNSVLMSLDNRIIVRFDPTDKLQYTMDFTKQIFFTKINTNERGRLEFAPGQNPSFIPD